MAPFDVVIGRDDMVCNSGGVTILCKSFEMLGLPVMQPTFGSTGIEGITVPATSFIAQLVVHCTGIAEVMASNPVQA